MSATPAPNRSASLRSSVLYLVLLFVGASILPSADAKAVTSAYAMAEHQAAARAVSTPLPAGAAATSRPTPIDDLGQPLPPSYRVDRTLKKGKKGGPLAPVGAVNGALTTSSAQQARLGLDKIWTYTSQEYGGGNTSYVNVSNGNVIVQHRGGTIPALGFDVDLTHTYNSQDSSGREKFAPDSFAWYGEGWSFAMDYPLIELDGGATVVFRDGTGMLRTYTSNGNGTYGRQQYYGYSLVKNTSNPPDKIYTLGYDAALRLISQTDPKDSGRTISYRYDSRGRRDRITYGSGVYQELTYDKADRVDLLTLKTSGGTTRQSFDYYYGFNSSGARQADYNKGNVISVTELDGSKVTYGYDSLNRLTSAVRTGTYAYNQSYGYDGNNNRTSVTANGTTTSASYDAANQMTNLGSVSYTYDRNGNLTAFGANTLSYDAANTWTSGTVNGSSVSFGYDGLGRRTNRSVGTSRTDFWYDQTGLTLESGAASATYLRDPKGTPLSVYTGTLYDYGRDRLGSVTGLVTTGGSLNTSYAYDPWGQSIGTTGTAYNPFQFTGVYLDSATGFYRMTQRFYQPNAGRFTQLDPLPTSIVSLNRYAYVNGNPVNAMDPSGLVVSCALGTAYALSQLAAFYVAYGTLIVTAGALAVGTGGVGAPLAALVATVATGTSFAVSIDVQNSACS